MSNITAKEDILNLLNKIKAGEVSPEQAVNLLRTETFSDLGYAKVDHHRSLRQGVCEVIFGQGKTPEQIVGILSNMRKNGSHNVLVTRISQQTADFIANSNIPINYHPIPQLGITLSGKELPRVGNIIVASGGTSDMAVCEEAALTAEALGNNVTRLYDVGVAGLHRLLLRLDTLIEARVIIVVAGMEGALPSVIGGLASCPVIAVPTSIGYGANFGGLSALLCMLNSCASGVSVVNIDNGFGAGFIASRINQMKGL
ncbi:MAG: nickel pincer cofactor biosynthesis protein LarB [Spirochaetaceae bacterium]|nr:nickel pincer cofactor biosynthesis protein LarB [Spirochaetaceae bacterium]